MNEIIISNKKLKKNSGSDYRGAAFSKSYLTSTGMTMSSLKSEKKLVNV